MPGTPATSPRFGAPRYDDSDDATFAEQVNSVTDTFDSLAVLISDTGTATTGDLLQSVATSRPGYVLCDGATYSRTDPAYSALFALIGTKYGQGDGTTTFNVPNLTGCAIVMADPTGARLPTNKPALGSVFGQEAHALTTGEMPAHNHPGTTAASATGAGSLTTDTQGSHLHGPVSGNLQPLVMNPTGNTAGYLGVNIPNSPQVAWAQIDGAITDTAGAHAHNASVPSLSIPSLAVSTNNQGGGAAHSDVQPSFAANIFIKL